MKKALIILTGIFILQACHNDQGGVVNDGKKTEIQDSTKGNLQPVTAPDSAKMRDREDIERRDTSRKDSLGK